MQEYKFEIGDMLPIAITIVIVGIAITYGVSVVTDVRDTFGSTTNSYAAANNTITGLAKLPEKLPTIVTVIVAAIIIGILLRYFLVKT